MEAEQRRWTATYTKHLKQKRKSYHDGALLLHPASGRLDLLDDAGDAIDSRFLRAGESVSEGASLAFQCHLVDVGEPQSHPTGCSRASVAAPVASRTAYRGGARARQNAANSRAPRAFVNPPKSGGKAEATGSGGADVAESGFQEWNAMYTTQLTQKAKKYHDGTLRLMQVSAHAKQIVLLDEEGEVLGSRYFKSGDCIESGKKCHFSNYLIEIYEVKNQNKGVEPNSSVERMASGENTSNKRGLGLTSESVKFISPQKFHYIGESKSEVTSSSNGPETDKIEVAAAGSAGNLMGSTEKEWSALYTTQLNKKAKKYHDGVKRLMQVGSHSKQIVLLDEEGGVLGSRYLKSDVEPKQSSEEALSHIGQKNGENIRAKTGDKSKSPKFVGPLKFNDLLKSKSESIGSNRLQVGKATCSNMGDPPKFHGHVLADLQRGKSSCTVGYRRTDLGKSAFGNMDDPRKFNDYTNIRRRKSECATSYNWPEVGNSSSNRMSDPLEFRDIQDSKSGCPTSFIRREVGSTFGNTDDSLRTASQILSIMKPPSEIKISQSIPVAQACSSASSESKITLDSSHGKRASNMSVIDNSNITVSGSMNSGLSHFATQLRTSVQSCLKLETMQAKNSVSIHHLHESAGNVYPTYDHQAIRRPTAFDGLELAMVDNPTHDMSKAKEQKLNSSSNHCTGNSNGSVPFMNVTTFPGSREDKSGATDQLSANNRAVDQKCGSGPLFAPINLTCKDPKIHSWIDDCPSFDLGL